MKLATYLLYINVQSPIIRASDTRIRFSFSELPFFATLDPPHGLQIRRICIGLQTSTGCSLNIVFFPKNSLKFPTSPSLALVCYWLYKKGQPIGATVHSHCVENFEGLLQRYVGEGGVAVNFEKHNFS